MTVARSVVPANFVPAAAVKRRGQALLLMTWRKGFVGGLLTIISSEGFMKNLARCCLCLRNPYRCGAVI